MSGFLTNVDEAVIVNESNPGRFERFCVDVVSALEGGVPVVGTSVVWDRGRDGRGIGTASGVYVCTSLRDDVDVKAIEDVERLSQTTRNVRVLYFCSSQPLTEHRCDKVETALREYFASSVTVIVLGALQLARLGREHGDLIERFYGGEIREIVSALSREPNGDEELRGLRLALLSAGGDNSVEIRALVYRNAVLDLLSDGRGRTIDRLATDISSLLRLGRPIDKVVLSPYVNALADEGFLVRADHILEISDEGRAYIDSTRSASIASFVEGRNAVRAVLEAAVGAPILDEDFQRIWGVFEDRLAFYLQSRGEQIVAEVLSVFGDESVQQREIDSDRTSSLSFLEELADAVAATARHSERQEAIRQAVKDVFADRTGDAAKWLVSVCAAFITACTMGLEHRSNEVILALMRRITLVLDTDVVLSLVGEGEPDHEAVVTIVSKWKQNRGQVLVGSGVLHEAAYHAFIAQNDFEQVRSQLPGSEDYRLRVIENAFVRSFAHRMAVDPSVQIGHWRGFISQFRGLREDGYSRLFEYLAGEFRIGRLPDRDAAAAPDVEMVRSFIMDLVEQQTIQVGKRERDKAGRDAELYVSLVGYLARLRDTDPEAGCLLISSARRIAAVDARFRMSGEGRLVISVASALYLVSLLPSVSLGLSALKSFLFEDRRSRFSSDFERTVLRMVSASKEHSAFVFSRRGLLVRELKRRLVSKADLVGRGSRKDAEEVERTALNEDNRERFIETLAEALDAVGGDSRTNQRLQQVLRELESTKRQLEIERSKRRR